MRNQLACRVALGVVTLVVSTFSAPVWAQYGSTTFVGGSVVLAVRPDILPSLTAISVVITPVAPATYDSGYVTSTITGVTLNDRYQPTEINSVGGVLQVAPFSFASSGGQVSIENLDVVINDPTHIDVYADVSGSNGLASQNRMLMWTSTGLTLGRDASVTGPIFQIALQDLNFTAAGGAAFVQGLGLNELGQALIFGSGSNFGILSATMQFADNSIDIPAVPEPSTYMLMLVGFGLTGWVARRRSR